MAMIGDQEMQRLVDDFAGSVIAQTDAIRQGDHQAGNGFALRYIAAFNALRAIGDLGRAKMASLLTHPRGDVRAMAACFLLRYKTQEALAVLRREAEGMGIVALEASEAIKRWEEGTWSLDPPENLAE
jgi:hypothetical protein